MWSYTEDLTIEYCHEYYLFKKNKGGEGVLIDKADCHGGLKKKVCSAGHHVYGPTIECKGLMLFPWCVLGDCPLTISHILQYSVHGTQTCLECDLILKNFFCLFRTKKFSEIKKIRTEF